jgi:hypothetical protein
MVEPHHIDRAYTLMRILDGIRHAFRKGYVPEMMGLGGVLRFPDAGPGCLLSNCEVGHHMLALSHGLCTWPTINASLGVRAYVAPHAIRQWGCTGVN